MDAAERTASYLIRVDRELQEFVFEFLPNLHSDMISCIGRGIDESQRRLVVRYFRHTIQLATIAYPVRGGVDLAVTRIRGLLKEFERWCEIGTRAGNQLDEREATSRSFYASVGELCAEYVVSRAAPLTERRKALIATVAEELQDALSDLAASDLESLARYAQRNLLGFAPTRDGISLSGRVIAPVEAEGELVELANDSDGLGLAGSNEDADQLRIVEDVMPLSKVFLVHGRDEAAKNEVARFLERSGLEVIILSERANLGRTLITKFQEEADGIGFAVVLLTRDDVGRLDEPGELEKPRARQNVVFEWGFFIGRLGAGKVCALIQKDVDRPSDLEGVVYIAFGAGGNWKHELARELIAAHVPFDAHRAFT